MINFCSLKKPTNPNILFRSLVGYKIFCSPKHTIAELYVYPSLLKYFCACAKAALPILNIAQLAAIAKGAITTTTRQSITLLLTAINLFKRFINIKPHLTIFKCTSFLNHLSRFRVGKTV